MDKLRMAACGIDCTVCGSYRATMENDMEAAEGLVEWYRSAGWIGRDEGAEAVLAKNPLCKGCWDSTPDCFFKCGCNNRDFRACCDDKRIKHCGECAAFPCGDFKTWASWHEGCQSAMDRLLALRVKR